MKAEEWIKKYEEYLTVKNLALNTVRAYTADAKMFWEDTMAGKSEDWNTVTVDMATSHLATLKANNRRDQSVARKIYSLKGFFKFLRRSCVVLENPFDTIEFKGMQRALPKILSVDEMNRLLNCIREPIRPMLGIPWTEVYLTIRDKAMLETLYGGALRVSELVGLNWDDVDFKKREARILGKGNKERIVPLGEKAIVALWEFKKFYEQQWEKKPEGARPIFVTQWETRMNTRSVPRTIRKWLKEAGIDKPVSSHWFRHSAATHMLDNGADIRVIQAILGHASIATTQIYTHVATKKMKAVHANTHPRA